MKRNFNDWFETFSENISSYDYYVDFEKVYNNVFEIKLYLNMMNTLIGSKDIKNEFMQLVSTYPEVIKVIPLLIAVRENKISINDNGESFIYNFNKMNYSIEQYCVFMENTGLFDLLENHLVNNLIDYCLGIEVGLDSNARKNRGGHLMEDLVEKYINQAGFKLNDNYFKEMKLSEIEKKYNLDLSSISNNGKTEKRFDFVVFSNNTVYAIECNFYKSSGSKLNETARSYKMIAEESKNIDGFKFVWVTDGLGWKNAINNLRETFDVLDDMYNINDLKNDIFSTLK